MQGHRSECRDRSFLPGERLVNARRPVKQEEAAEGIWLGLVSPYPGLELFIVRTPTVLRISTVDFPYTALGRGYEFQVLETRGPIGHHPAPMATISGLARPLRVSLFPLVPAAVR